MREGEVRPVRRKEGNLEESRESKRNRSEWKSGKLLEVREGSEVK